MLLMIMFPKALPSLLLTPPTLTIYPETFWKLTLPSPEAGILSSPRIAFSVLGEELISSSLQQILDSVTGRLQYPCLRLLPSKFSLVLENRRGILLFLYTICEGWRVALLLIL